MKKIDKLILDAFIGPFLITFFVVVFILLNINMLKYFDDIIGKGLDGLVLGQLFFYFAIFTIPTAMPLAVLLSSLIAFGNLGEHFELTAIKSAGISLLRVLLIGGCSAGCFSTSRYSPFQLQCLWPCCFHRSLPSVILESILNLQQSRVRAFHCCVFS